MTAPTQSLPQAYFIATNTVGFFTGQNVRAKMPIDAKGKDRMVRGRVLHVEGSPLKDVKIDDPLMFAAMGFAKTHERTKNA